VLFGAVLEVDVSSDVDELPPDVEPDVEPEPEPDDPDDVSDVDEVGADADGEADFGVVAEARSVESPVVSAAVTRTCGVGVVVESAVVAEFRPLFAVPVPVTVSFLSGLVVVRRCLPVPGCGRTSAADCAGDEPRLSVWGVVEVADSGMAAVCA
jgi:hypothetical protein